MFGSLPCTSVELDEFISFDGMQSRLFSVKLLLSTDVSIVLGCSTVEEEISVKVLQIMLFQYNTRLI